LCQLRPTLTDKHWPLAHLQEAYHQGHQVEQEHVLEYGRLHKDVVVKLRHHAFVDGLEAGHVFQYLILPSFTPPISWDVFRRRRRGHEDDFVLVRSTWRSDLDLEKLRSPVERLRHPYPLIPSVELHQLNATSSEVAQLAAELAALRLPIGAPPSVGGIDGVTYEVAIEQPPHHIALTAKCRLTWWHRPPVEWDGLAAWVKRAEAVFESAWVARGTAAPTPLRIKAIDDAAARHEAQRLFHAGQYGRAAEVFAEVGTREKLSPAEAKMLELSLKRAGGTAAG
jgi:hypothetical protein